MRRAPDYMMVLSAYEPDGMIVWQFVALSFLGH